MLYSLRGKLINKESRFAVVECGGVGFGCHITVTTFRQLDSVGEQVLLYTMMNVREDAIELFGFADRSELSCFQQLIAVNGVGPKAGLAILSELSPERVALAIASGDFKMLTKAAGVGPKLAQRIVLELKDKFGSFQTSDSGISYSADMGVTSAAGNAAEAVGALGVLGFSASEAAAAIRRLRVFDRKLV